MPLSESEEPKIDPLFKAAFARVSEMIHKLIKDENKRRFYKALLIGGNTVANAVVAACEGVKKAWGDGDEAKALALTKLFTLLMLSQCYRWIDKTEPNSGEEQKEARKAAASKILYLFEDDSEEVIEGFLDMDTQFGYDLEYRTHLVHTGILLLAKACEACSHKCIEWSKVSFPIGEMPELVQAGAIIDSTPLSSTDDIAALWRSYSIGVQAMMKHHEEQAQL